MSYIPTIGLMSGTSVDGIDLSLVLSNGLKLKRTGINSITPYRIETKNLIEAFLKNPKRLLKNEGDLQRINGLITVDHANAVKKILKENKILPKLVGFHGQTVLHDPKNKSTFQLGDGVLLSKLLKIDVVCDFRSIDIEKGGQGAPIAPIYHKSIIEDLNLDLPSVVINIGGIANLTYWDGNNILGFDTGPGNNLMDNFMQINFKRTFDENGSMAKLGKADFNLIKTFLNEKYFNKYPPKSLDRLDLFSNVSFNRISKLKDIDAMATFCHLTALSIRNSFKFLPKKPLFSIIVGGGQNNKFLVSLLKKYLSTKTFTSNELFIPGDFIESELIAFLSVRKFYNLPSSFPNTTGVREDTVLGKRVMF